MQKVKIEREGKKPIYKFVSGSRLFFFSLSPPIWGEPELRFWFTQTTQFNKKGVSPFGKTPLNYNERIFACFTFAQIICRCRVGRQ